MELNSNSWAPHAVTVFPDNVFKSFGLWGMNRMGEEGCHKKVIKVARVNNVVKKG